MMNNFETTDGFGLSGDVRQAIQSLGWSRTIIGWMFIAKVSSYLHDVASQNEARFQLKRIRLILNSFIMQWQITISFAGTLVYVQNDTHFGGEKLKKICVGMPFAVEGKAILRVLHRVAYKTIRLSRILSPTPF